MIADILVLIFTIVIGIALLFPIPVRILFRGSKVNGFLELRIFRKKLFSTREELSDEKTVANGSGESSENNLSPNDEKSEDSSVISDKAQAETFTDSDENSSENFDREPEHFSSSQTFETADRESSKISPQRSEPVKTASSKPSEKSHTKKEKPKKVHAKKSHSSDREFLTILIEPKFSKLVLKGSFRISRAFFRIFHCQFETAVVDGIRTESMDEMGYIFGGLNFLSGTVPFFENWEFGMDWEGGRPFRVEGCFCIRFSVARVLGFCIVSARWIAKWIVRYFLNSRRYRKCPKAFRLIFWRRWIVRFFSPERS